MAKRDARGRKTNEHVTYIKRSVLSTDAWRALSPKAQSIYVWLKFEWKGTKYNNGRIKLSCRQAAKCVGIGANAAMTGFHELQAKGFIIVTKLGALGVEGEARGPSYELTELPLMNAAPKALFIKWKPGSDFEVRRHKSNNPKGKKS